MTFVLLAVALLIAALIVLPTPDDAATVDVYVVAPACPPGELLYFVRAARP